MIHDIEILESQLTFKDDDWILLTDENKDIIGHRVKTLYKTIVSKVVYFYIFMNMIKISFGQVFSKIKIY